MTSLSLVAEDEAITAANDLAKAIAMVGQHAHHGDQNPERWRQAQIRLAEAQLAFVNAARQAWTESNRQSAHDWAGPTSPTPETRPPRDRQHPDKGRTLPDTALGRV
ncbi:hypothetical protein [Streptomyces sp. CBMA152]|uniref:hypothetical protein n=1 Tax=Streptomyces sp. CBMA152 TaxID=1896312 RepID=UPI0016608225|nr:hypothetical protein [Streptomyces sp. CBMA152]